MLQAFQELGVLFYCEVHLAEIVLVIGIYPVKPTCKILNINKTVSVFHKGFLS